MFPNSQGIIGTSLSSGGEGGTEMWSDGRGRTGVRRSRGGSGQQKRDSQCSMFSHPCPFRLRKTSLSPKSSLNFPWRWTDPSPQLPVSQSLTVSLCR